MSFDRHSISPSVPVEARGPVVTSSSVQQAVQDRYAQTAAPCSHGNLRLPGVSDGVVGLNCCEVRGAVIPELMCIKKKLEGFFLWKHIFRIRSIKQTFFFIIIQNDFFSLLNSSLCPTTPSVPWVRDQLSDQHCGPRHSPSHGVQSVADGGHAHPCPPGGHGRHHVPTICPGVVRLTVTVDGKEAAATCGNSIKLGEEKKKMNEQTHLCNTKLNLWAL